MRAAEAAGAWILADEVYAGGELSGDVTSSFWGRTERVLVSDAAAQLAARLLKPAPDDVVVDIGSGRGTKTLLLQAFAVQSGGPADITAVDDDEFKARILTSRMNRHGVLSG